MFVDDPECFIVDYSNVTMTTVAGNPTAIAYLRDLVRSDPVLAARAGQLGAVDDAVFATILLQTGVYGGMSKLESPVAQEVAGMTLKEANDMLWKLVLYRGLDNVNRCPPGARFDITSASGTVEGNCVGDTADSFLAYQVSYIIGLVFDNILHLGLLLLFFYALVFRPGTKILK